MVPPSKEERKDSLGDFIDDAAAQETDTTLLYRLLKACFVLFISLSVVYSTILLACEMCFNRGDMNNIKMFQSIDSPYKEIVEKTIPKVQEWYRSLNPEDTDPLLERNRGFVAESVNNPSTCIESLISELRHIVPRTSPDLIRLHLTATGLIEAPVIQEYFVDLLDTELDLSSMYQRSLGCLKSNVALEKIACNAMNQIDFENIATESKLPQLFVNEIVVLDILTEAAFGDLNLAAEIANAMLDQTEETFAFLRTIGTSEEQEFYRLNYHRVLFAITAGTRVNELATNSNYNGENNIRSPHLDILEATKLDIAHGFTDNRVGVALAANVNFFPSAEEHKSKWAFNEDWVNAYIAWNLGFVLSLRKPNPGQLLMPSLACSTTQSDGNLFLQHRLQASGAAFLGKAFLFNMDPVSLGGDFGDVNEIEDIQKEYRAFMLRNGTNETLLNPLTLLAGQANMQHVVLTSPSRDRVERMLYSACGEFCHGQEQWKGSQTSPTDHLSDFDHQVYVTLVVWGTAVIAGLSSEFAVWMMYLQAGWNDDIERNWKLVQLAFPVLGVMAFGLGLHQNFSAMLFLVLGLYKFGFPETLVYMYRALHTTTLCFWERIGSFLDSVGTCLHHASASLAVSLLLTGILPPERYVTDPILVMMMQHWFVGLKYVNQKAYIAIELALEVWVEWSLISQLEIYIYEYHWLAPVGGAGMLVAHWFYVVAAAIGLVLGQTAETGVDYSDTDLKDSNDTSSEEGKILVIHNDYHLPSDSVDV